VSSGTLVARILPPALVGRRRARYLLERNLMVYRRAWLIIVSGFAEPVFYLYAIGVGMGGLVGDVALPGGQAVGYAAFLAPALMGSAAMNGAVIESTMNIFFKLRYVKTYDAMLATPVEPADIAVGEISWSQLRGFLYAAGFLVVMAAMGLLHSPWALLALPAAVLIGFAFASVGMVAASFMRSWQDFDLIQLVTLPLFLFSATFFPLEVYPRAVQPFVQLSPLYHGVALLRSLTLGDIHLALLGHVAFLLAMTAVGTYFAARRFTKLLLA
jgi:lipooligosaccharide transport system permease protein